MLIFLTDIKKEELNQELLVKLEQASTISGIDYTITSGYRPGINGIDHGIKNGPHMTHKAADIRVHDSVTRFKMLNALFKVGFRRIGIGSKDQPHIHVDVCSAPDFPQVVLWLE